MARSTRYAAPWPKYTPSKKLPKYTLLYVYPFEPGCANFEDIEEKKFAYEYNTFLYEYKMFFNVEHKDWYGLALTPAEEHHKPTCMLVRV